MLPGEGKETVAGHRALWFLGWTDGKDKEVVHSNMKRKNKNGKNITGEIEDCEEENRMSKNWKRIRRKSRRKRRKKMHCEEDDEIEEEEVDADNKRRRSRKRKFSRRGKKSGRYRKRMRKSEELDGIKRKWMRKMS